MDLHKYDLIIVNSSGGKDSLAAILQIVLMAEEQDYDKDKIVISHQDLGDMEWPGTKELVQKQADHFGLEAYYSKRKDKNGKEETLLEYVERRGKWPSNKQRYCTSDFKRGPGARIVTQLTKGCGVCSVLYVFGFRAEESPARAKKDEYKFNDKLSSLNRSVYDYLPIHDWSEKKVWEMIHKHRLPYHPAYDLGMPRLSCMFCIFAPLEALVIAGRENPALLDEYIAVEERIGHTFRDKFSLKEVKMMLSKNLALKPVENWRM
jgi:3'-phosphoadenosine 5'-phosphosulfate sulfotransferase (PAPS reductase)/FAD synthetase